MRYNLFSTNSADGQTTKIKEGNLSEKYVTATDIRQHEGKF
jgi:hypothetical protein